MTVLAWLPILFVALIAVPAVLGLDHKRNTAFRSFRDRMRGQKEKKSP